MRTPPHPSASHEEKKWAHSLVDWRRLDEDQITNVFPAPGSISRFPQSDGRNRLC